jgi:DNA-binding transcriptional LysR family regulator
MDNVKLNLDNLIAFLFVAKEKSFSAAAARLFLTQPAVTTKIKCLERQFGVKLFATTGKDLQLTEVGKSILPLAEEIYRRSKEIEHVMGSFKDSTKGVLRLGAARSIAQTYLPVLVNIFNEHFPNIQISVTEGSSSEIIQKISEFKHDLGIIPKVPLGPKFTAFSISSEKMEFVGSGGHPLAHRTHIPMKELLKQPFIIQGEGSATRSKVLDLFDKYSVTPTISLEAGNQEMIKNFLLAGKGIALIFPAVVKDELEKGLLRVLNVEDSNLFIEVQLVFLAGAPLSPSAKEFTDLTLSTFATQHL